MILPIYTYGQSVLREETAIIEENTPELQSLITSMIETMYNAEGVGLAAPQIGQSIQLLTIDARPMANSFIECENFVRTMINPEIIEKSEETDVHEEGCLSIPGIGEKVTRPTTIRVKYLDEQFKEQDEVLHGFAARVVQHEYDHLHGRLFIDQIAPIRKQLIKGRLANIVKGKISCSYKTKPFKQ